MLCNQQSEESTSMVFSKFFFIDSSFLKFSQRRFYELATSKQRKNIRRGRKTGAPGEDTSEFPATQLTRAKSRPNRTCRFHLFFEFKNSFVLRQCSSLKFELFINFVRLKPLDIQVMKALHHKVNIVPIIAKADTLTLKEVKSLKQKVSLHEEETILKAMEFRSQCNPPMQS